MSFHFPTKNSQILLDFRPNPGEPSLNVLLSFYSFQLCIVPVSYYIPYCPFSHFVVFPFMIPLISFLKQFFAISNTRQFED